MQIKTCICSSFIDITIDTWWLWCSGNTEACGAFNSGSTPGGHPIIMQLSEKIWSDGNLIKVLKNGGVAVMPTDTLYGIVGRAENISTVERIYNIRKRKPSKPCIVLIGDASELEKLKIKISEKQKEIIKEYSSSPTSIILDCSDESFSYLHRGTKTLALRLPGEPELRNLLLQTGPLIAPSANIEGQPPAKSIQEAKNYFGNLVDLYVDGGDIAGKASKIIRLQNDGSISIIRE